MTKYKEYLNKMLRENTLIFDDFKRLHDNYSLNPEKLQREFNDEGGKILEIIRDYENRLCSNTERGMYNKFSANLAQKFQDEVRKQFPMIDHVGLKVEKTSNPSFFIKRIRLS